MPKQERNEIGEVLVRRQAGELLRREGGDRRHLYLGDSANLHGAPDRPFT